MIIQCHGRLNTIETRIVSTDGKPHDGTPTKYLQLVCSDSIGAKLFHLNKAQLAVLIRELQVTMESL